MGIGIIHPLKISSRQTEEAIRLVLQIATTEKERAWVRQTCREQHYLHREVHGRGRPVSYMVVREEGQLLPNGNFLTDRRERVGILVFARMESSRCAGWYGSLADVQTGWAKQTQWEIISLARCWLDPRIQKQGEWFIECAAGQVVGRALQHIHYDYLLSYPPAYLNQPWLLQECISYCQAEFDGILYRACNFRLARENREGLKTYSYPLPKLTPRQRRTIELASRTNAATRQKRGNVLAQSICHEVLLIVKYAQSTSVA